MNGFAVEGNYFNFSTSGQWMWDEIQFAVPADADPFAVAEAVKEIVATETQEKCPTRHGRMAKNGVERRAPGISQRAGDEREASRVPE